MMLLSMIFTVRRFAVGVPQLPGYWILSPPIVNPVWFCSAYHIQFAHMWLPFSGVVVFGCGGWRVLYFSLVLALAFPMPDSRFCFWMSIANHPWTLALLQVAFILTVFLFLHLIYPPQICCCHGKLWSSVVCCPMLPTGILVLWLHVLFLILCLLQALSPLCPR